MASSLPLPTDVEKRQIAFAYITAIVRIHEIADAIKKACPHSRVQGKMVGVGVENPEVKYHTHEGLWLPASTQSA